MGRSEWLFTLPLWRHCLAMLNWRPVYDIEQGTKRLEIEIAELAEIESRLDALLRSPDSCLPIPAEIDSDSSEQSQP